MPNFDKLRKMPREEQDGIIRNTPEFNHVTKLLAKWQQTGNEELLFQLKSQHELVVKYALRRFLHQRQITRDQAEHILNIL